MMLNKVSLNTIGFNRIGLNRIGKPSRASSDRPYIDPEVLASLKAVCICYGKSNDDPDRAVVKNLVDLDNPFVISNAAYKLNSGFGKYGMDFLEWKANSGMNFTSTKLTYTKPNLPGGWLTFRNVSGLISETKVKVSGAPREFVFIGNNNGADDEFSVTINNGVYTIPEFTLSSASGFYINNNSGDWSNLVIEQIPSFEGAFVTDGIDDLIKSTKSATEMLDGSNEVTVVSMIHQIKTNDDTTRNNWFFTPVSYLENRVVKDKIGKTGIYGYTSTNVTNAQISDITPILGDKNDYTLYSKIEDGDRDYFTVEGFQNQGIWYVSSIAWYWTIIANKVLTTDQINQVIAYFNLDKTLKPDILCNITKQGITNDNHADFNDKLIDYSGNGRDIQLNNLAWKGDSGIGKYEVDFSTLGVGGVGLVYERLAESLIIINSLDTQTSGYSNIQVITTALASFKIKIEGLKEGERIGYKYNKNTDDTARTEIDYTSDGIYELPASVSGNYAASIAFGYILLGNSKIIITQIPSHAGALCLDGVDDFGKVTGMPIYKDYTVVTDREIFTNTGAISSKNNLGAFVETAENSVYSFGQATTGLNLTSTRSISYLSKYSYRGQSITAGAAEDGTDMWLGTIRDNDSSFFNGAIYSLMSFPYSMSEFLIERQLKKHKLGTLYPDMVEFRPVIKSNVLLDAKPIFVIRGTSTYLNAGDYVPENSQIWVSIKMNNIADRITKFTVNGKTIDIPKNAYSEVTLQYGFPFVIDKSPQKINITIDEYIRFEDIVQPYPVLLRFKDENGNKVSWGGKFKVGSTITRIGSIADPESNLLNGLYSISGLSLNGKAVTSSTSIVEKQMVFRTTATWLLDNNEPKCILSPRLLRIPNSSYKILGHIPDISGHGNHGKINNSAYAEGSGVNEDGSYQFDGVDDFVTIPTLSSGGKQVLMKVNWNTIDSIIYDQRGIGGFAIYCSDYHTEGDSITVPAYKGRNAAGTTYIDGIRNEYVIASQLRNVTHNIVEILDTSYAAGNINPIIGKSNVITRYGSLALYDFMFFDDISTDDKIKELNEYVGIEGNVWGILTQLSNSTLISNETFIKNE